MFAKVPEEVYQKPKAIASKQDIIQPLLFWPSGGGALAEEMLPKMGYSIMGTFNRWRPQPMENEAPGVYSFTTILSENRWERFQIALDGESTRFLHPIVTEGDKCCPVAGPEAALQVLSWQIDGRPKGPRLVDAGAQEKALPGSGWQAIAPDALEDVDADLVAEPGDKFRIRLHLQGRWRMVDWEKLPQVEKEDTPAERAFEASLTGLVGTYQVAGSWNLFDLQAMKCNPLQRHRHHVEVIIPRDGEQHFYLVRNEDRNQVIGPAAPVSRTTGSALLSGWNQRCPLHYWVFYAAAGDVFNIEFERTADQLQVNWNKVRSGDSVPEELTQMHLRKKYMVRFCFDDWSNHSYQMSWTGDYYQVFVELNELAKASFLIYEEGTPSRCLYPSIKDAHCKEEHELQGPGVLDNESLFWTIGAEEDKAALGSRYEIRLRLDEGVPTKVDWVPVKSTNGLEEAAAKGYFVGWLPAM